jgi:hypothetical protein
VGAWAGLLLLIFNLAAGALAPLPAFRGEGPDAAFSHLLDGEHLLVCTAGGMVEVGHPDRPPADHASFCVFCLPLMNGSAVGPSVAAHPAEPADRPLPRAIPPEAPPVAVAALGGGWSPRAPPLS